MCIPDSSVFLRFVNSLMKCDVKYCFLQYLHIFFGVVSVQNFCLAFSFFFFFFQETFIYLAVLDLGCTMKDLFKVQHVESSSLTRNGTCALHWEHGVLATGSLGKSLGCFYLTVQFYVFLFWYILDTSHLSDMCFANICSQSVACIFHSLNCPLQNRSFYFYYSPFINWCCVSEVIVRPKDT